MVERNRLALLFFIAILGAWALIFYAARKTGNGGFPGSILSDVPERSGMQENFTAKETAGYNAGHSTGSNPEKKIEPQTLLPVQPYFKQR